MQPNSPRTPILHQHSNPMAWPLPGPVTDTKSIHPINLTVPFLSPWTATLDTRETGQALGSTLSPRLVPLLQSYLFLKKASPAIPATELLADHDGIAVRLW